MRLNNFPIITNRRLKLGVVGCGRISKNHFGSILQYPEDLELSAVCDIDSDALKQAAAEYNVEGYTDLKDMLATETLDLVVLCTPSGLHPVASCSSRWAWRTCCIRETHGDPLQRWIENGSGMR